MVDAIRDSKSQVTGRTPLPQEEIHLEDGQVLIVPKETKKLYAERLRIEGPIVREALMELVTDPEFKKLPQYDQVQMIEAIIRRVRAKMTGAYREEKLQGLFDSMGVQ